MKNPKFKDVEDVLLKTRYVNGPAGARCTSELKKECRFVVEKWFPYDAQIFGFEYSPKEIKRAERFVEQYPTAKAMFPLIAAKVTKSVALAELRSSGIELPAMYKLGYHNSNCIGCVKGGKGYWNKIRNDFPEVFAKTAKAERAIKATCIKGVYLDELDPSAGNYPKELTPDCGVYCQVEMFED